MTRFARWCSLAAVVFFISVAFLAPVRAEAKKDKDKTDKPVLNLNEPAKEEAKAKKPKAEDVKKPEVKPEPAPTAPAKPEPVKPEPAKPAAAEKPAEPATHTVKKEAFKIELTLNGTFEPQKVHEVALRPELWQNFIVTKIVDHGAKVKKGDVLIQYDTKQLDEVITDSEAGRALADLEYQAAQEQLSMLEETIPMDMAAAERAKQYFDEDIKRWLDIELPMNKRTAEESVKQMENMLAYEMEEMKQLQKMYKADDLTEETEEIILRRQQDVIKRIEFMLERSRNVREQTLNVDLVREQKKVKDAEKISELRVQSARSQFPRMLAQQRLMVQKLTRDREKSLENLKKLKRDRGGMTVKSPIDGYVYYGQGSRGQFAGAATLGPMLSPGNPLKPGMVLMTVVAPRPMHVRTTIAEGLLSLAAPGIAGKVTAPALPDVTLAGKLESVAAVPLSPGNFDAKVSVVCGPECDVLVPGMSCSVKLLAYEKKDAITVPSGAVFADEGDDAKKFVYIHEGDKKHRKQEVKTGRSSSGKTEILSGVKEGEKVLLNKP